MHKLSRMDLNLLIVFDAVLTEKSVTKAAQRLSLSQTAISHSLARLRAQFGDPLFVRDGSGMCPTPRATEVTPLIRGALEQIDHALSKKQFKPGMSEQFFRLAITEYFALLALPRIARRVATEAENTTIITVPNILTNVAALLDNREVDFAIAHFQGSYRDMLPPRFKSVAILEDHFVCVMRKSHPLAKRKLTRESYAQASHLVQSLSGELVGPIDRALKRFGVSRKMGLLLCHHSAIPELLNTSDMILTVTGRMAKYYGSKYGLHVTSLPFNIPPSPMQLIWSERVDASAIHVWLRSIIIDECKVL